ncbi:MAG: hypothetical protein NC416_12535 [Eubacterium sp.]|nr:hypothetical protein [Eubacterium sp.]
METYFKRPKRNPLLGFKRTVWYHGNVVESVDVQACGIRRMCGYDMVAVWK